MKRNSYRPETLAVRGGARPEKKNAPLATPIYQSSTFQAADLQEQVRITTSDIFYTRYGNPTHSVVENALAALEGAQAGLLFASGMAAITTSILAVVKSGDHIVAQRDLYGGTVKFLNQWLPRFDVETTMVETTQPEEFERALRPNTRLLYLESPTNPTLKLADLERVAAIAGKHRLLTFIDNTFATPINQRPIEFGIDLVLHSGTKYLGGHSDLICGAAAGGSQLIEEIRHTRTELGGVMDPHAAFLLLRGIKTLAVRVKQQNENALQVAEFLAHHPKVRRVHYPFLSSHPQRALAEKQMRGGGGLLSFEVDGSGDDARRVAEALQLFNLAPSLGGVDSLVTIPVLTSHAMVSAEQRRQMGITEQLLRLAVGIESAEDLIADLEQGLGVLSSARRHAQVG